MVFKFFDILERIICNDIKRRYQEQLNQLDIKYNDLYSKWMKTEKDKKELIEEIENLKKELSKYEAEKEILRKQKELEDKLNSKYPKRTVLYKGRYTINKGWRWVDVRDFFINPNSYELQATLKIIGIKAEMRHDDIAAKVHAWVTRNIKYVPDKKQFKLPEYWMYPQETLAYRQDDCEGGATLIANLLIAAGIPYWKVRVVCGDVYDKKGNLVGGHCYTTYYLESKDRWIALDWCFYPDLRPFIKRKDYKEEKIYGGEDSIWFSFNQKYAFSTFRPKTSIGHFKIL